MIQKVRVQNKILFEIETIDGIKYFKKEDKEASKRAGKPVYIRRPIDEIFNSDKEVINIK
ncbi:hypothetical protein [Desulforamulus aquiferis]|uniref:Uncharacterized protein n=1 Tax=Desulforamulus aquiferis TaxID=1397668 RepID=A0AAW7Z9M5_9FIRM|nr:hypothetical protein [Desulforamulus aquiferis]MDO7786106.1 hypothetical protein [Desulforamulus aquiferis]